LAACPLLVWIGTRVAEDVVQQLRMAHMQQSGIMNGHMSVCKRRALASNVLPSRKEVSRCDR
jgi:hypothetical protein